MAAGRRVKPTLIITVLLASGLALLAWTQVWVHADVAQMGSAQERLAVTGSTAAPGLSALALAGLALAGALTIAGPVIRVVLGILEILLGASVLLGAVIAVTDPATASAAAVTAATGIAGTESILTEVVGASVTAWPFVALFAAAVMVAAGVGVVLTGRRWPGPTARYQDAHVAPATSATAPGAARDPVDDWDGLSRGDDPTA